MTNPAQEILIIGLGLIGSSLAKATKNKGLVVHGYDLDQTTLVKATDNCDDCYWPADYHWSFSVWRIHG